MAEKACHVVGSATQVGLTQALVVDTFINFLFQIVMKSTLRWIIAIIGWIVLLMIFGIWKSLDKEVGTSAIIGGIRGAIVGGGIFYLYYWARNNPQKHIRRDSSAEAGPPQQDNPFNLGNYYKIVAAELQSKKMEAGLLAQAIAEGNGDKNKAQAIYIKLRIDELIRQSMQNDQQATKEKSHENDLIEQGCSKEAIDYLKDPIHIYSYTIKYKKTEGKILDAIKKGKLRGCYVGEALWIENKKF